MSKTLLFIIIGLLAMASGMLVKYYMATAKTNDTSAGTQYLPDFRLPDTNGVQHGLPEWQGKVLVINFWATWCTPCRREIADFIDLQTRYGNHGLQVIGIAIDDKEAVDNYLKQTKINYPVLIGSNDAIELAGQMGNNLGVVPFTVIAGADGHVVFVQLGEVAKEKIQQAIKPFIEN